MRDESQPWHLLCVGSLERRKNHLGLFKALLWLKSQGRLPPIQLTLVGWAKDQEVVNQVQRAVDLGLSLKWEADADDDMLVRLYGQCDFTVYPSLEEGFGLPVAESLWHQRICLCSADGALGEISRYGGCCLVNTQEWRSIAAGLVSLFQDQLRRTQLQQQVASRKFRTWRIYAEELVARLADS